MFRIRRKFKGYEEVEFSRRSPVLPANGRYNNDGYWYDEVSRNANTLVYERRMQAQQPSASVSPPVPRRAPELPKISLAHSGHLPARQKRMEGAIHREYYAYDRHGLSVLVMELMKLAPREQIAGDLVKRISELQTQQTVSASKEIRDYLAAYDKYGKPPYSFPPAARVKRVAEDIAVISGAFKAKSMKFVPLPGLHLSNRSIPRVGDPIEGIERDFDVLSRRSAGPPLGAVSEVETGRLPSQRGIPIERGMDSMHVMTGEPETTINPARQSEKVMAIGLKGALDFKGEATVGVGRPTRVYALLLPKGAIAELGVKMRDQDSPSL